MDYIKYIERNSERIKNNEPQSFTIESVYNGKIDRLKAINNPDFQQSLSELLDKPLSRSFVKNCFNASHYTGFVATMLWGGLGLTSWQSVEKAMMMDKKAIESKVCHIKNLLKENKLRDAFMSLQANKSVKVNNKISGVDISFFTKLLFFLHQDTSTSTISPIIYDKWGCYIHAGLLISQEKKDLLRKFYRIGYNKKNQFFIKTNSNKKTDYRFAVYSDYLQRMSDISRKLDVENPGILEEFLFGKELKSRENKDDNNPRYFVKHFVEQYYSPN